MILTRSNERFLCFIIHFSTLSTIFLSYEVKTSYILFLIMAKAVAGLSKDWNLEFHVWNEVETYTRGNP